MDSYEDQVHALAAKYTALRNKYDALYTQSLEAARTRRKLGIARERIAELERAAAPDLLAALKLIWSMFDDGRIVRNIANDGEPDWALKMLNFTRELQTIQSAIAKAEGK